MSSTIRTGTFDTAQQVSSLIELAPRDSVEIILTNTGGHDWQVYLDQLVGTAGALPLSVFTTDTASTLYVNQTGEKIRLRLRCTLVHADDEVAYTLQNSATAVLLQEWRAPDGSVVFQITETGVVVAGAFSVAGVLTPTGGVARAGQVRLFQPTPKVGTTAGWVVGAADNLGKMATLPQSQTGSTLVVQISGLKVGDTINGFHLNGSIQSAGNTGTLTAALRKLTAAAAGAADSSVGAMAAPLSVIADTVVSSANAVKTGLTEVVAAGESFYVLITATTGAAVTQEIQSVGVTITEA